MAMTLKEQRQRAFLSTRELAEEAGVAPDTVWRIEGRLQAPTASHHEEDSGSLSCASFGHTRVPTAV